ncbi:hypothetical protein D3C77_610540 [compost metagenome]
MRRRVHTSFSERGERSSRLLSLASARLSGLLAALSRRSSVARLAASARSERNRLRQAGLLCMRRCSSEAFRSSRASAKPLASTNGWRRRIERASSWQDEPCLRSRRWQRNITSLWKKASVRAL